MPAMENESTLKETQPVKEEEVLTWIAPARPFKKRNKSFYVTLIAIAALFGMVLFLVEGFMPVLLIISLVFLFYVLSTVEPDNVEYKVTNLGIKMANSKTEWSLIRRFWFTKRLDTELLVFELFVFPGRLEMVMDPNRKTEIKEIIAKYVLFEEAPASFLDKASNWFAKRMPGGMS